MFLNQELKTKSRRYTVKILVRCQEIQSSLQHPVELYQCPIKNDQFSVNCIQLKTKWPTFWRKILLLKNFGYFSRVWAKMKKKVTKFNFIWSSSHRTLTRVLIKNPSDFYSIILIKYFDSFFKKRIFLANVIFLCKEKYPMFKSALFLCSDRFRMNFGFWVYVLS